MNILQDLVDLFPRDKLLHIGAGVMTIMSTTLLFYVAVRFGPFPALAMATTLVGVGIEGYQWIRKEGEVSALDALATAAPGWVLWAGAATWGAWHDLRVMPLLT